MRAALAWRRLHPQYRRSSQQSCGRLLRARGRRYRGTMTPASNIDPVVARRGLRAMLAALTLPRVAVALALAVAVAVALNPIFITPFPVVLGRLLLIAMVLLLAFTAAGAWQPPGLSRWLAQVLAVGLAAPLATLIAYLPSVEGDVVALFRSEPRLTGFILITCAVLVIAPVLALGALYRERDAQARSQALSFELEKSTLEKQALDAQLKLLHAQIEPHFLFNTLANVQELVESGSPQAAAVLRSLIAYLRAAMPRLDDANATLGAEAGLVRAYLELMRMRMVDRLGFDIRIPAELAGQRFPAMAMLTLVENAVRHGIDPQEQGGRIDIVAHRDAASGEVSVWVCDTGVGLRDTAPPGTGLTNLRARLRAFYGPDARLEMQENSPRGLKAGIVFRPAPAAART
jgi:signal transduction histidine kinase